MWRVAIKTPQNEYTLLFEKFETEEAAMMYRVARKYLLKYGDTLVVMREQEKSNITLWVAE